MRLAVINLVGPSRSLLGEHIPGLAKFAQKNGLQSYKPRARRRRPDDHRDVDEKHAAGGKADRGLIWFGDENPTLGVQFSWGMDF